MITYNHCNLCESDKGIPLFQFQGHDIVKCGDCGLVYIKNQISPEDAKRDYEENYYKGSDASASSSCYVSGEGFRTREANLRLDRISGLHEIGLNHLLDVGCGPGFFLKAASDRGIEECVGVDISENAAQYAQKIGLDVRNTDLLDLEGFSPEYFDAITFWASIEHLYDPKTSLQRANELLKPGGLVALETGDINSPQARLFGEHWRLLDPDHNFYFSSSTLDEMLRRTGFETIRTDYDGFTEGIITQLCLRKMILNKFSEGTSSSRSVTSSAKEVINTLAGRLGLGDVMLKYARKK